MPITECRRWNQLIKVRCPFIIHFIYFCCFFTIHFIYFCCHSTASITSVSSSGTSSASTLTVAPTSIGWILYRRRNKKKDLPPSNETPLQIVASILKPTEFTRASPLTTLQRNLQVPLMAV